VARVLVHGAVLHVELEHRPQLRLGVYSA
jgi:hypothetical protein